MRKTRTFNGIFVWDAVRAILCVAVGGNTMGSLDGLLGVGDVEDVPFGLTSGFGVISVADDAAVEVLMLLRVFIWSCSMRNAKT